MTAHAAGTVSWMGAAASIDQGRAVASRQRHTGEARIARTPGGDWVENACASGRC